MAQPLGIYVSVPFCRAKCTFCHFASQAFPPERMQAYVDRLLLEIRGARAAAGRAGLLLPRDADTIFFGGGTPSLLSPAQFVSVMEGLRSEFALRADAEITMEAAPGQLPDALLDAALAAGVNRISLGVQSFVDREAKAVGRLHTGAACLQEIARLQRAGVRRLNVDLIAGLPHQTATSLQHSLDAVIGSAVEHVSVYMLELDEESRLGREVERVRAVASQLAVLGEEARYSAGAVPSDEACAELYQQACAVLESAGLAQYEISNFARAGGQSRHNRRYWQRDPYIGFGLDAHSMLPLDNARGSGRFATVDDLTAYLDGSIGDAVDVVDGLAAFEETVFLSLRLREGVSIDVLRGLDQRRALEHLLERSHELAAAGLMERNGDRLRLTAQGRVLSSSVFGELLAAGEAACAS